MNRFRADSRYAGSSIRDRAHFTNVTSSGSGLDPDISPEYARLQADRIAKENGLPAATVRKLVADVSTAVGEQRKQLDTLEASLRRSSAGLERVTTGPELDRALKRLDTLGERMDTVTASLDRSAKSVETTTGKFARGEGTLGKLMTDDELYRRLSEAVTNMNQATVSMNQLAQDIQKNPRKYINLKVF